MPCSRLIFTSFKVTNKTISQIEGSANPFKWFGLPLIVVLASVSWAQPLFSCDSTEPGVSAQPQLLESKRILGIIPNNRTSPSWKDHKPLSIPEKFEIARRDSFDRGTVVLAALFAADAQLTNASPSFGQGARGYAHYFGTSYGDFVIGNYLSEAIYPVLLHQDPRYFRHSTGNGWSRVGYAVGQIFWTHTDSNRTQFNYS